MVEQGLHDGTRLTVIAGRPTTVETAALVAALDAARAAERAARRRRPLPAWQRAAYLEAAGGRSVGTPAQLARP